jgi:hypothetical protein
VKIIIMQSEKAREKHKVQQRKAESIIKVEQEKRR